MMDNLITIAIFGFGFIVMPFIFFYIMVVKQYKKIKRCSEAVQGRVLDVREEKRVTRSDNDVKVRYIEIATCEYYYGGNTYESEVEYPSRRFSAQEGEDIEFYINPENPYETYKPYKGEMSKLVATTCFLLIFLVSGVVAIGQIATSTPVSTIDNSDSDTEVSDKYVVTSDNHSDITGSGMIEIYNVEEILELKNKDNDISKTYIDNNAMLAEFNGVKMYLPHTYSLTQNKGNTYCYSDYRTKESIKIVIGNTKKSEDEELQGLRKYVSSKYKVGALDKYIFNGNSFEVYTCENANNSYTLLVIAVNKEKKLFITYESGEDSTVEFRDILSSIIF